jgi:type II secretory pathway predicted ATPase ExeA
MYTTHFGLREPPFDVSPDPRFFYTNPSYREAAASLEWGIQARRGVILLTGDAGTGKTTLLRRLMTDLAGKVRFGLVSSPASSFDDLLSSASAAFGVAVAGRSRFEKLAALTAFLTSQSEAGVTSALLIDEAQDQEDEVLESLRLLSNLETPPHKLLQIVLVGQPELELKLARPCLGSLKQRIAIHCRLSRLRPHEIGSYIRYRLNAAGYRGGRLFGSAAVREIAAYSSGFPRLVNIICDNALLITYVGSQQAVSALIVREVARDLGLKPSGARAMRIGWILEGGASKQPVARPATRTVRRRPYWALRPIAAVLALLGLGATALLGWQAGPLSLVGTQRELAPLRGGAIPRDPQGGSRPLPRSEHLASVDPVPDERRSNPVTDQDAVTPGAIERAASNERRRPPSPRGRAPVAQEAVAVRPDRMNPVESSLPLLGAPVARASMTDPGGGRSRSAQDALQPPLATGHGLSHPSIESPPVRPSLLDRPEASKVAGGAEHRSRAPRSVDVRGNASPGPDGMGYAPPAPPPPTARTWALSESPGPSRVSQADAVNSGAEIIDWLLHEGQGRK